MQSKILPPPQRRQATSIRTYGAKLERSTHRNAPAAATATGSPGIACATPDILAPTGKGAPEIQEIAVTLIGAILPPIAPRRHPYGVRRRRYVAVRSRGTLGVTGQLCRSNMCRERQPAVTITPTRGELCTARIRRPTAVHVTNGGGHQLH